MKVKGFTIVELLIVIVIIGIFAAITIVAYNGVQQRSKTATAQSDMRNLAQQIQMRVADSTPLGTSEITKILKDANLHDATRDRSKKEFSFCYNNTDNSQFAIVAFNPFKDASSVADGDKLYAWSTASGFKEVTYLISNGGAVGLRACSAALPSYTHQVWSFNA